MEITIATSNTSEGKFVFLQEEEFKSVLGKVKELKIISCSSLLFASLGITAYLWKEKADFALKALGVFTSLFLLIVLITATLKPGISTVEVLDEKGKPTK